MRVRIEPAPTTEGLVYARMLAIELEERGFVLSEAGEAADLWLVDGDHREAERLVREHRGRGTCLVYGGAEDVCSFLPEQDRLQRPMDFVRLSRRLEQLHRPIAPALAPSAAEERGLELGDCAAQCRYRGRELGLSEKEYALLRLLAEHRGQVLSAQTIYRSVWQTDEESRSNLTAVLVRGLRAKLDVRFGVRLILSVKGRGYTLAEEEQA